MWPSKCDYTALHNPSIHSFLTYGSNWTFLWRLAVLCNHTNIPTASLIQWTKASFGEAPPRALVHHLLGACAHNSPLKTHSHNRLVGGLPGKRCSLSNFSTWSRCLLNRLWAVLVRRGKHCLLYIFHVISLHGRTTHGQNQSRTPHIAENNCTLGNGWDKTRLAWRGPEKSLRLRSPRGL